MEGVHVLLLIIRAKVIHFLKHEPGIFAQLFKKMALEIEGKLIKLLPQESGVGKNGNSWVKQGFVIGIDGPYPKEVCISAWGDMVKKIESLQSGQMVKASVDISSREFNGKYYTDVKAWKIDVSNDNSRTSENAQDSGINQDVPGYFESQDDNSSDDLPF